MIKQSRAILVAIMAVSILLRVAVALYLGDSTPHGKDETSYSVLAARVATGHGYSFGEPWYPFAPAHAPTSHWSFLYTAFVAAVYAVAGPHPFAARLVQAVVAGALMPWLIWRLTKRLQVEGQKLKVETTNLQPATFNLETIPLLAAALSAVYAYFVLYGAMVQTEAFYICALLWSLERSLNLSASFDSRLPPSAQDASFRRGTLWDAVTLGLSLGVATLLRQSILPWVAVLLVWLLWPVLRSTKPEQRKSVLISSICVPLVLVACIAPFTIRNAIAYDGNFLLLNSNAGYAMYSAQHPDHGTSFREYWAAPLPADLVEGGLSEAQWDKELMRRGIGFVLADPVRYLRLSLSRVRDFFEFWPTSDSSTLFNVGRVLSIGVFLPFMLYGIWLATKGRSKTEEGRASTVFHCHSSVFLLLFMAFYSALHIMTWAMSRYRLPIDAVALPFAALAIATIWRSARILPRHTAAPRSAQDA